MKKQIIDILNDLDKGFKNQFEEDSEVEYCTMIVGGRPTAVILVSSKESRLKGTIIEKLKPIVDAYTDNSVIRINEN